MLEGGELTYYTDKGSWERGEKPLKGHRIAVRTMTLVREPAGADLSLEPAVREVEAWGGGGATSGGSGGGAPSGGSARSRARSGSGGAGGGTSSAAAAKEDDRVWCFICEGKADLERWAAAFVAHGAAAASKPPA